MRPFAPLGEPDLSSVLMRCPEVPRYDLSSWPDYAFIDAPTPVMSEGDGLAPCGGRVAWINILRDRITDIPDTKIRWHAAGTRTGHRGCCFGVEIRGLGRAARGACVDAFEQWIVVRVVEFVIPR